MANEDKQKSGLTTFLVLLSALGMLAIVIAVGFAFFFPGSTQGTGGDPSSLANLLDRNDPLSPSGSDPSLNGPSEDVEEGEDHEIAQELLDSLAEDPNEMDPDLPVLGEPDLDDADALIDSLMSDSNLENGSASENLNIQFDTPETQESEPLEQVASPREEVTAPPANQTVRYETRVRDIFWIQVASFPNSIKAEELQLQLQTQGISSTIHTRDVQGTFYYRVRIGAFNTRDEADNFNQQILSLPMIDETTIYTSTVEERVAVH